MPRLLLITSFSIVLLGLIAQACVRHPAQSAPGVETCLVDSADTTFLQLWNRHSRLRERHWQQFFQHLKSLGFEHVIIQWTQYAQYRFTEGQYAVMRHLLAAAADAKITLTIGLQYDPDFWQRVASSDPADLRTYLKQRLDIQTTLIESLAALQARDPNYRALVKGYYVSDEIDDSNWSSTEKRAAFARYLHSLHDRLSHKLNAKSLSISAFSNGIYPPKNYAQFLAELLKNSSIEKLLFQDGVGVKKLTEEQSGNYLVNLIQELEPSIQVQPIVEVFIQENKEQKFSAQPATVESIVSRLNRLLALDHGEIAIFSAPDYLLQNMSGDLTDLGKWWLRQNHYCKNHPYNKKL